MKWTLTTDRRDASHAPVVVVNGSRDPQSLILDIEAGEGIILDAGDSYDPDGHGLMFS